MGLIGAGRTCRPAVPGTRVGPRNRVQTVLPKLELPVAAQFTGDEGGVAGETGSLRFHWNTLSARAPGNAGQAEPDRGLPGQTGDAVALYVIARRSVPISHIGLSSPTTRQPRTPGCR